METWVIALILFFIFIIILVKFVINIFFSAQKLTLPPSPSIFPIIGNFLWLRKSFHLEPILRSLHAEFGSTITLNFGKNPSIFIADRYLTHQALIQNGAIFSDRPPPYATTRILSSNQHTISTASNGSTWRLLRQNLTTEILRPSLVKSNAKLRNRVLQILLKRLCSQSKSGQPVCVTDHFHYSMFALLALLCFDDKLDENKIKQIEQVQQQVESISFDIKFKILNFWPRITKIMLCNQWKEFQEIFKRQEDVMIPLIRARKFKEEEKNKEVSYADTLLSLELSVEDERKLVKLDEGEIISLCSEFLNAGSETTSTALQWIMANLVKYPQIQEKLFMEIKRVMTNREEEVKEDDLHKVPYLKAVILEGLRKHPPLHFGLPHAATEDTVIDKYVIPKNGIINFNIAQIGLDPKVWEDPMDFKPERFLNDEGGEAFDVTGSKKIKMMPFGVGRRMCPGYGLAMLHLEYFIANLIWNFEWKAVDGDDIDLSEKVEFTVVMNYPLHVQISPRLN